MRLHHVQVACPPEGEAGARRSTARASVWSRSTSRRSWPVAAHPAFLVADLEEMADRLRTLGFDVDERERDTCGGHVRFHTVDAHGNRVEVLATTRALGV